MFPYEALLCDLGFVKSKKQESGKVCGISFACFHSVKTHKLHQKLAQRGNFFV